MTPNPAPDAVSVSRNDLEALLLEAQSDNVRAASLDEYRALIERIKSALSSPAPATEARPKEDERLTLNDLALTLMGVQHAQAWWDRQERSNWGDKQRAAFVALNHRLSAILDKFSLPENDEGEKPDNGDDIIALTWERAATSPRAETGEGVDALVAKIEAQHGGIYLVKRKEGWVVSRNEGRDLNGGELTITAALEAAVKEIRYRHGIAAS